MHIETELDDIHAARLLELQKHSDQPLAEIVAQLLAQALDEPPPPLETEGGKVLRILEQRGLLGCMEGDGQLAVDYKNHLWGKP
ncbi:hypothetical protein SAMN02949497_1945 [Methylomagnum ishizawai]|uniref:Uncharacterized protein n=1 Tax=Methylomagnum ishizawai TaxID=1760988 RepID=A0A1Y6D2M8_9GAMM|nr:hypothetical protein [Methylomagnum ishizawai]SMF94624.1 hypothetical protein SAMN02949497_1945 [Methylomagnum ishizawai]